MEDFTSTTESLSSHLHPHPLVLGDLCSSFDCLVCGKSLESGPYYSCPNFNCYFSLHKSCAELPQNINHPRHSHHLLTLHEKPPNAYSARTCDFCGKSWKCCTYHCFLCDFDIDIFCAFQEWTIRHASHDHDLNLLKRLSLFLCDACGRKGEEDESYVCTKCQFWIHCTCALSPATLEYSGHHHSLTINYKLPRTFSNFRPICNVCNKEVKEPYWFYSCAHCRYFVHMKCSTSNPSDAERNIVEELVPHLSPMPFPIDNPLDVIRRFVEKMSLGDNKAITTTTTFNHFSHNHLLQFCEELNNETESDKRRLCKVCVQPISAPFYHCDECSFSLHKCCADIPQEVRHRCHPVHRLFHSNSLDICRVSWCVACDKPCNGLRLKCSSGCDVSFDVGCAALLNSAIKHEAHHHALFPSRKLRGCNLCNACGQEIKYASYVLGCDTCDFNLHLKCAMLPHSVKHRWDKHPLLLSYPPFIDYPEDFYCEDCEKEIDPQLWLYHCKDCDQSFHPACLCPENEFSNVNNEATVRDLDHTHSLTYAERSETDYQCNRCSGGIVANAFFECQPCNYRICCGCVKRLKLCNTM